MMMQITPPPCSIGLAPAPFVSRLEALLSVYAKCRGDECYNLYRPMHPDGSVTSFQQAMNVVSHWPLSLCPACII